VKNADDGRDDRNLGIDDAIERRLGRALQNGAVDAGPCPDAELLAAWVDDGLDADERTAVEAHAASCGRCQATLAGMIRAVHAAGEAPPLHVVAAAPDTGKARLKRVPVLAWLVPLTAIAAAVIVWIAVPQRGPTEQREAPAQPADQIAAAPAARGRGPEAPPSGTEQRNLLPSPRTRERASSEALAKKESAQLDDHPAAAGKQSEDSRSKDQAVSSGPVGPISGTLAAAAPRRDAAASAPPASASPAPNAAPAPMAAEAVTVAKASGRAASVAPDATIISTNPTSRWRIVSGGAVQHSVDGGSTWQTQQTGSSITLTAGVSPSESVCWLVGPEGTVLLSTDGRTWRKIAFPEATALVGVSATDDRTATVTFADGRTLATTDAGVSWQR
jgi:hypothetical protein